jgi:iron(III) transport system permease protein
VPGIVWVHLMARSIADKVILLTPAFRNMDAALEEAARVSGGSNLRTMLRVTLPVMTPPIVVVFALHLTRAFDGFEIEQLLGTPIGFFVYSTQIYNMVRETFPPEYGEATALASVTLLIVALIVPLQRWLTQRHNYTVVTGSYRPGLVDMGTAGWFIFAGIVTLLVLMVLAPLISLALGSVMYRAGIFSLNVIFSMRHWSFILAEDLFWNAFKNTILLATTTAIISPILFAIIAYVLVRTKLPGRALLDTMIWTAAVVPGMLAGLGLLWMFLGTSFLVPLYGTLWPLIIVIVLAGKTTGTQLSKSVFLQIGADMEEAARVSGAGSVRNPQFHWRGNDDEQHHSPGDARHLHPVDPGPGIRQPRCKPEGGSRDYQPDYHGHHDLRRARCTPVDKASGPAEKLCPDLGNVSNEIQNESHGRKTHERRLQDLGHRHPLPTVGGNPRALLQRELAVETART